MYFNIKRIFSIIISCCLINLHLLAVNQLMAKSIDVQEGKIITAKDGSRTQEITVTNDDSDSDELGPGTISLIMMLVIAFIAWRIIEICFASLTTDIMIAAAAGTAFIAGEAVAIMGFQDGREEELKIFLSSESDVNNKQVEALEKQRDTYQEMYDTANTKFMLQAAAAVGFTAAAGVAVYQSIKLESDMDDCLASAGEEQATAEAEIQIGEGMLKLAAKKSEGQQKIDTNTPIKTACETSVAAVTKMKAQIEKIGDSKEVYTEIKTSKKELTISFAGCPKAKASCEFLEQDLNEFLALCAPEKALGDEAALGDEEAAPDTETKVISDKAASKSKAINMDKSSDIKDPVKFIDGLFLKAKLSGHKDNNNKNDIFNDDSANALDKLVQKIVRLMTSVTIASAKAETLLKKTTNLNDPADTAVTEEIPGMMDEIDNFLATPGNRAIIWGGLAAMTAVALSSTSDVMDTAQENIHKLDEIIAKMKRLGRGTPLNEIEKSTATSIDAKASLLKAGVPGKFQNLKTSGNSGAQLNSSNGFPCSIKTVGGKCASVEELISSDTNFDIQGAGVASVSGKLGKLSDGISGSSKLSGTILDLSSKIGKEKNAIDNILRRNQTRLNQIRAKKGKAPVNVKRSGGLLFQKLQRALAGTGQNSPFSNGGLFSNAASKAKKEKDAKKKIKANVSKSKSLQYGATKKKRSFRSLKGIKSRYPSKVEILANERLARDLTDISKLKDIVDDEDASLFDVLSSRYIKSGIPRLNPDQ